MPKFRNKPTTIDAVQFDWKDGRGIPDIAGVRFEEWTDVKVEGGVKRAPVVSTAYVVTIHGQKTPVVRGDWIITEPDGRHYYPCKPDIFAARYEPLT